MPTIAIDASSAAKQVKTGVEWYAFRLIEAMKLHALREGERVVLFSPAPLPEPLSDMPDGWSSKVLAWPPGRGWMPLRVGWELLRTRVPLLKGDDRGSVDVLFVPAQGFPSFSGSTKLVGVLHDVEFLSHPDLYRPEDRLRLARAYAGIAWRSARLLGVSEYAKKTSCAAYGIDPARVDVTPLAPALPVVPQASREPFFLALGRVEKKKGADVAVRAFESFKEKRPADDPYELRFLGGDGFGSADVRAMAAQSPYAGQIRFAGHASDAVAAAELARATALLALSRAEGFGLAPLEALRAGTPVIASDIPPFHEVGGDVPLFVPVDDPDAAARELGRLVSDASLRERLSAAGPVRAAAYSWDETARLTWEALRRVLY